MLNLLGPTGNLLDPLLQSAVSPTIIGASDTINVIPSEVVVDLDGRLLLGIRSDDMMAELHQLLGDHDELAVVKHEPGPPEPDMVDATGQDIRYLKQLPSKERQL